MHLRAIQHQPEAEVIDQKYRLGRELATGGTASLFEARHQFTGWSVALKLCIDGVKPLSQVGRRLLSEARILGGVQHPNVVRLIDAGICHKKGPYVALELLEGRPLDGILTARGTLSLSDTLQVARGIGKALEAIHHAGIVHRDVKPANIFLATSARGTTTFKLVDFGIARRVEAPTDARITEPGELLGTLDYMPPEQLVSAQGADPRSDQYALGVVLFECLTGNVPGLSTRLVGSSIDPRALLVGPDVPVALSDAIHRMLSVDPEDRFPDMASALAAIPEIPAEIPAQPGQNTTRRRFPRAPYTAPCRVLRSSGNPIDGRIEDISRGGLLVVLKTAAAGDLPQFAASGEEVSVRFALPTTGLVVAQRASVRWVKDARGRAAIGVEFVQLAPDTARAIDAYVTYMAPSVSVTA